MVTLEFSRSPTVLGALIRAATWSEWDHVSFVLTDGSLFSAMAYHGVGVNPLARGSETRRFVVAARPNAMKYALAQRGKPYDWSGVLGIGLHRDWHETDSWTCSELVAWALERAGSPLLRADHLNRVTPGQLALSPMLRDI